MATQQEKLAQLRSLNTQLGLPEDDGIVSSYDQKVQELRRLDEQLAKTPESFEEYVERRKVEDARSLGQKSSAFLDSFMEGGKALAKEGANAIGELFAGEVGTEELGGVYEVGKTDFGRFAKTIGGSVMDNFYSDEEEMRREYQRYVDNFLYNQEVRPAMLNTYDEEGRDFVSFGANFIDPTLLVPAGGLIAKGGSLGAKAVASGAKGVSKAAKAGAFAARSPRLIKLSRAMAQTSRGVDKVAKGADKVATGLGKASEIASIPSKLFAKGTRGAIKGTAKAGQFAARAIGKGGEITSKVAGAPRSVVTKIASSAVDPKVAGSGILGAQVVAAGTGAIPGLGLLTATEGLGYIANKTGRGMERVLGALSSSAGQKRFLQRLATSAESKAVRRAALFAHRYGGTRLGDIAFNMLANGATVGSLNAALAYAAGEGPEGVGAAAGSGAVIGGALPFGQSGMRGGKTQKARDEKSISNFLDAKLAQEQREQFSKLSPEAKLAFATVEEAGIKAPTLEFLDGKTYLNLLREETPNLRKAPEADFDETTNTITVNTDGSFKKASELALEILSHELGHGFIRQAIKDDPFFASKILKEYQPKKGEESFEFSFTTDSAGSPIDSIQVNSKAKQIAELYDSIQQGIGIGTDANKLAQEIGAEQFAMMMVDNGGNLFKSIEPSLRQKLLDASRKVLGLFGVVDPQTGNPLSVSILGKAVAEKNPILQRSKTIRNLYKNYVEQKEKSLVKKIDLADNPIGLKLEKGENAQQAVQRLFNTKGLSLKEAGAFRIKNRQIKKKLIEIRNRLFEKPEGEMGAETNEKGNPVYIVGKKLTDELKGIFTRNDPFGNINTLINMATEAIMQKAQMTMLYRAGKPSKYSDNELRPRVIAPVRFKITGLTNSSRSAASLKLDAFDEAYLRNNAEVLVAEGFEKNPNNLIDLGRQVALDAMNDPEGRINPKGKYENEVVTALFGQPESAPQIRNPKLRRLLEEKRLKHAYRTYDIDGLAGLVPTGKSGISFDWFNVRNNYLPYDQNLFMPRQSKNFDKKVALRTNEDIIKQIDILAQQKGVSRNDLLNEILRDRVTEKTPDDSGIPVDSENVPPITEKEFQNLKNQSKKKPWSKDSDQDLNWLRNEPKDKFFMPMAEAMSPEVRRAKKEGLVLQELQKRDMDMIRDASKKWKELGTESPYFQDFMNRGPEDPVFAEFKNGVWKPETLYYNGTMGADSQLSDKFSMTDSFRRGSEQWTEDSISLFVKRKDAYKKSNRTQELVPAEMATNVRFIFDANNPDHIDFLRNYLAQKSPILVERGSENLYQDPSMLSPEIRVQEDVFENAPVDLPTSREGAIEYAQDLKDAGWDGFVWNSNDGSEVLTVFNPDRVKLIKEQRREKKFFSKDRTFGAITGLFGARRPSQRGLQPSTSRDVRFMPQMELDFDGSGSDKKPVEAEPQGYTFWQLTGIDKNDKNIYKKVSDVLINTGTPEMDPQTALDYGPRLGLDVKRLRQEMEKAQARYRRGDRLYLPTAYHGTPHSFEPEPGFPLGRFRSENIGTGEGFQAYGYGLYFADKKEVAKHYSKIQEREGWEATAKAKQAKFLHKDMGEVFSRPVEKILNETSRKSKDLRDMYFKIRDEILALRKKRDDIPDEGLDTAFEKKKTLREYDLESALRLISEGYVNYVGKKGSLYKVELAPKENEYLLWDKSLSEQPKEVREKIEKLGYDTDDTRPGSSLYQEIETSFEPFQVSRGPSLESRQKTVATLIEAGIRGIKYLDGSSRSKGEGDYNYVIFDDADVQITDKLFMPMSDMETRVAMQKFLTKKGDPFFAEKVKGGFRPQVLFHRGTIGEKIGDTLETDSGAGISRDDLRNKDIPEFAFQIEKKANDKFFSRHFGLKDEEAIYTSENLGGRFSRNIRTASGELRKTLGDDEGGLPKTTIRVITNISKVWDYANKKDTNAVLKELKKLFVTPEMYAEKFGRRNLDPVLNDEGMRQIQYGGGKTDSSWSDLQIRRRYLIKYLNDFNLFKKYNINKQKLLKDDNYLSEVERGVARIHDIIATFSGDLNGILGDKKRTGFWGSQIESGYWVNEMLIPIIKGLGYDGMRNLDSDSSADIPSKSVLIFDPKSIKLVEGKGFVNYGTFDANNPDIRYMPASEAGAGKGNILFEPKSNAVMAKAGDIVKLPEESLRLFLPASPKVNLGDYADRKIFALTTDRLGIGQMATGPKGKKKPIEKDAQGGRGFIQIYNGGGWAFSTKDAADRFITRVKEVAGKDNSALVGLTVLADINHLKSQYGQLAYANALRAAIETGVITQRKANEHINSIIQRILESKSAKSPKGDQRKILENIKSFADYEKAVKNKKINFALADWFFARKKGKASQATLPIGKDEALELGLDLDSIAKDIADPELAELEGFGQVVGLLEIFKDQQPVKSDFHYSYPWTVEGKKIGFLKEFMDVGELASTPKIRDKFGSVSAQPLQTVMPEFDQLKNMQFMPKAPTRQPANRIQQQAPLMPANRFMAPAASAGARLSERFR